MAYSRTALAQVIIGGSALKFFDSLMLSILGWCFLVGGVTGTVDGVVDTATGALGDVTGGLGTGDLLGGVIDTVDGLIGAVSGNTSAQASAGTDGANASGGSLLGTGLLAN